jgi:hypothetical protein
MPGRKRKGHRSRRNAQQPGNIEFHDNKVRFKMPDGSIFEIPAMPSQSVVNAIMELVGTPLPGDRPTAHLQRMQEMFDALENIRALHNSPELREMVHKQQTWNPANWTWYNYGPNKKSLTEMSSALRHDVETHDKKFQQIDTAFEQRDWKKFFKMLSEYGFTADAFDWRGFRESYGKGKGK